MLQINNRVHFNVMNINKYHEATTIILKIISQIFKEKKKRWLRASFKCCVLER